MNQGILNRDPNVPGYKKFDAIQLYSEKAITESAEQTLRFFEKASGEFTNMQLNAQLEADRALEIIGMAVDFVNTDGANINWAHAGVAGLKKFIERNHVELNIGSANHFEGNLLQIVRPPIIASSEKDDTTNHYGFSSLALQDQNGSLRQRVYEFIEPILWPEKQTIKLTSKGTAGAYASAAGFSAATRMLVTLYCLQERRISG
ncbi:MAG: hypothetical protein KDK41_15190 [Leptospiraceae bacterium]|nr:hypothetical protein [Leptospiraceae bacterium]